ncbi:hypothetical protein SCUCBS95973_007497 [Sporothrix curviconia]|uniref:Transmembrane protein n=1 Tax=Sporothrix curviconia TaxID=1260050 RepID=A0ABP0CE44_9PEZI
MARPKSSKSSHKGVEDSVTVATEAPPSPPTTRNKTYAAVAEVNPPKKTRKHRRSKSKSEHSHNGDSVDTDDDDNKLASAVAKKTEKARPKASKASSATKKQLDSSLRKAKKVVGELSDSFEEARTWPLPGVLSDIVEGDVGELGRMAVWSLVSLIVSTSTRVALGAMTTGWSQTWVSWPSYFGTEDLPSIGSFAAMLVSRMIRMTLSNGYLAIPNLAAINILYYGPIVYLLSSYYNVPLSSTLFSEGINFASEFVPLFLHHYVLQRRSTKAADEDESDDEDDILLYDKSVKFDAVSFAYSSVFAAVLYGFTFVQACRFFLPTILVVHFFGIATVEPARAHPLLRSTPLTIHEVFSAVFQSVPAVLLNLACGVAARTFIFNHHYGLTEVSPGFSRSAALYRRIVTVRTAALSLSVGLSIFLHCFFNIQGVDAVGASVFASIWAVAPLLVGVGLAFTGV